MYFRSVFLLISAFGCVIALLYLLWVGRAPLDGYRSPASRLKLEQPVSACRPQGGFSDSPRHIPDDTKSKILQRCTSADGNTSMTVNQTRLWNIAQPEARVIVSTENGTRTSQVDLYSRNDSHCINPHGFKLIIDQPRACLAPSGSPKDVLLLVLVMTVHKNFARRRLIRETWGSPREVGGRGVVTLFLLAHTQNKALQRQVVNESSEYHDLIQEDFVDSYRNLTYKTIMGLKWALSRCAHASFVMKTDDDMYVSYVNLVRLLSQANNTRYIVGHRNIPHPIRSPQNKWYMPVSMYPRSTYPPNLSGTGYVMSLDVVALVYQQSLDIKFVHLEDIFVALCWEALGYIPTNNVNFKTYNFPYSYCSYRILITSHGIPESTIRRAWSDQQIDRPCRPR